MTHDELRTPPAGGRIWSGVALGAAAAPSGAGLSRDFGLDPQHRHFGQSFLVGEDAELTGGAVLSLGASVLAIATVIAEVATRVSFNSAESSETSRNQILLRTPTRRIRET
jgi:hypothetical protein